MSKTYTITLEFEVKATSYGSPASGPSHSGPGEPAEGPELEIETIFVEGETKSVETLYKEHKEGLPKDVTPISFDQFFANLLYDKVLEQAYQDDWTPDDDYDPSP